MADVAALAGVSHQTVSRVLNDHPSVSAKAREQVLRAITQLGYRRNLAARTLATGNSRVIGVLVSTTSLSGPSGAMLAIEENARTNGYWVSMGSLQVGSRDEVIEVAHHFIDQGVDGVIAVAQTQSAVDATLEACSQLPTVLVTSGTVPDGCFTVDIDQHGGAQQAMTILRGLGHTRIAHVSGPAGDLHAAARAAAWRESLPAAERERALVVTGDWSAQSGYQAALALQALDHPPTAVFAANDRMAYGVLRAAYEAGAHVPRDLSVVGFDDIEGSDCTIPPLTTIRQNHDALGAAALQLLLEAIRHEPVRRVKIPPEPVFRASAGAPVS
jgi:DNA-binding LacI/PurR family transcriptional regulator